MWIWAASQSTSSPFIQILSVGVMAMGFPSETTDDEVADLGRGAGERRRVGARLADAGGGIGLAQVLEHHGRRQDGGDRVGLLLAGDVGRRAVGRVPKNTTRAGPGQ